MSETLGGEWQQGSDRVNDFGCRLRARECASPLTRRRRLQLRKGASEDWTGIALSSTFPTHKIGSYTPCAPGRSGSPRICSKTPIASGPAERDEASIRTRAYELRSIKISITPN